MLILKMKRMMRGRILKLYLRVKGWDYPSSNYANFRSVLQLKTKSSSNRKRHRRLRPVNKVRKRFKRRAKGRNKKLKLINNTGSNFYPKR
jgi:hypothetical protein